MEFSSVSAKDSFRRVISKMVKPIVEKESYMEKHFVSASHKLAVLFAASEASKDEDARDIEGWLGNEMSQKILRLFEEEPNHSPERNDKLFIIITSALMQKEFPFDNLTKGHGQEIKNFYRIYEQELIKHPELEGVALENAREIHKSAMKHKGNDSDMHYMGV